MFVFATWSLHIHAMHEQILNGIGKLASYCYTAANTTNTSSVIPEEQGIISPRILSMLVGSAIGFIAVALGFPEFRTPIINKSKLYLALSLTLLYTFLAKIFNCPGMTNLRVDNFQHTPLHIAALRNSPKICKMLIQLGAHTEAKNIGQETPLHSAAAFNHSRTTKLLLKAGANIEALTNTHMTPLHYAILLVSFGIDHNASTTKLLIHAGANTEAQEISTRLTPLHFATLTNGNTEEDILELLRAGCNTDTQNIQGMTAVQLTHNPRITAIFEHLAQRSTTDQTETETIFLL